MTLTKQTAQTLIKREFGLPTSGLKADTLNDRVHIYKLEHAGLVASVSNDWMDGSGYITLTLRHRSATAQIKLIINPETMEQDFEEEERRERAKEVTHDHT